MPSAENMLLDLLSIIKFKMRAKTPAEEFNLKLEFAMSYCGKYPCLKCSNLTVQKRLYMTAWALCMFKYFLKSLKR